MLSIWMKMHILKWHLSCSISALCRCCDMPAAIFSCAALLIVLSSPITNVTILQIQQQRVTELTLELQETNNKLDECRAQKGAADQRITEMAQELENSAGSTTSAHVYHVTCFLCLHSNVVTAVVFKMHYAELLSKEDEIARLKAIIQGLSTNK